MKKLFYILIILGFLIGILLILWPKPIRVESEVIKRGKFVESFFAEGKVRSKTRQTLYAFANGSIENLNAKSGDHVRKGQTLTTLLWDSSILVKSPIDGVITKIYRDSAGPVVRGEPIVEISSMDDLEVVAEVLTTDAVRLNKGSAAQVMNWGGKGSLAALVSQISRAGLIKTSALGVEEERTEVKLSLTTIPKELIGKLGDNYHVDVSFTVSEQDDVLMVPLGAVFQDLDSWSVYIMEKNRAHLRKILITKKNSSHALLEEGLSEGEKVILFPSDKIREGVLVK